MSQIKIASLRHPDYIYQSMNWATWRETFRGGEDYLNLYLMKFSNKETDTDFQNRKSYTPIPTFAKAAVLDVRNSIFQRLGDITRTGGTKKYHSAMSGEGAGVDRNGASMNSFLGIDVLTEVLVMGRAGIFVDAPAVVPTTMAEEAQSPYLYYYAVEDILSWTLDEEANDGTFKAVLLRDNVVQYNSDYEGIRLPEGRMVRYRLVWKDDFGGVWCKFWDENQEILFYPQSEEDGSIALGVGVVPFILVDIGDSLLTDVSSYQKALLNLVSGDVNWALRSNVPFLTIQQELRTAGAHLKKTSSSAVPGGQPAQDQAESVGGTGRYYDVGMDRPDYIAPPTAPLEASMKLQEKLEDDIRRLINLAVTNKSGSRTESAEAKKLSSQGLEAGLSFIGMVLQKAEQAVARYWSLYENQSNPQTAVVAYPDRYILKGDQERLDEAQSLLDLADRLPGTKAKKTLYKMVAQILMAGKLDVATIQEVVKEIQAAGYTTSKVQDVLSAHSSGLVGDDLASQALGYKAGEAKQAKKDLGERHAITLVAQSSNVENPAARGVPELDPNPNSPEEEKNG